MPLACDELPQQEKAECASCAHSKRCTQCTRNCDTMCISKGIQESAQEIMVVHNWETALFLAVYCIGSVQQVS